MGSDLEGLRLNAPAGTEDGGCCRWHRPEFDRDSRVPASGVRPRLGTMGEMVDRVRIKGRYCAPRRPQKEVW